MIVFNISNKDTRMAPSRLCGHCVKVSHNFLLWKLCGKEQFSLRSYDPYSKCNVSLKHNIQKSILLVEVS